MPVASLLSLCINAAASHINALQHSLFPYEVEISEQIIKRSGTRIIDEDILVNVAKMNPFLENSLDPIWRKLFLTKYGSSKLEDFETKYRHKWNIHFSFRKLYFKCKQKLAEITHEKEENVRKRLREREEERQEKNKIKRLVHKSEVMRGIKMLSGPSNKRSTKIGQFKAAAKTFQNLNRL